MSNDARSPRRRRATQIDVARAAGVSQATVSTVLRDPEHSTTRIPDETRDRVLAAARELGYTPNAAAQRLVGGRTYLLGFHTFENVFPADQQDFYFPFLLGVESEASRRGYDLMLLSPSGAARGTAREGGLRSAAHRLVMADGGILVGRHLDPEVLADLVKHDFPFVLIGRRQVPGLDVPFIGVDYAEATARVVAELAARGHRRLGYIGEPGGGEQSEDRLAGYWRGIDAAGLRDGSVKHGTPLTVDELRRWTQERRITAVVVEPGNDDANVVALERAATELGIAIPGDLSVAVLGDPPFTATTRDWTRFVLPRHVMGEAAVELLIELLDGDGAVRQQLLPAEVVLTETVGVAPPEGAR